MCVAVATHAHTAFLASFTPAIVAGVCQHIGGADAVCSADQAVQTSASSVRGCVVQPYLGSLQSRSSTVLSDYRSLLAPTNRSAAGVQCVDELSLCWLWVFQRSCMLASSQNGVRQHLAKPLLQQGGFHTSQQASAVVRWGYSCGTLALASSQQQGLQGRVCLS